MELTIKEDADVLIEKLEIASIQRQLARKFSPKEEASLNEEEIRKLIGYASIFSISENPEEIAIAYEIVTRLIECTEGQNTPVIPAAELILSRIGNFPGRSLLRSRHYSHDGLPMPTTLRLECLAREAENTLYLDDDRSALLTDFQYKLFDSLANEESLSVSAPTSAGKSFVLNLNLINKIKSKDKQCIAYIVPTRALISEVSHRIRSTLREESLSDVIVRTAPFPVPEDRIKQAVVYVFTQERLMSFINSQEGVPHITSLIVDEAHEIQKGKRGIILHAAIDIALSRFNLESVFFASPLIKNPSYFLSLFGRNESGKYFVEPVSPVSQNLILVSDVKGKTNDMDISLVSRKGIISAGIVSANFKLRGSKAKQKANLANDISSGEDSVIVFSNGPAEAEKIANNIKELSHTFDATEEILSFIDFIKREIHPDYPLVDCLLNGVAFHYGSMPSLVRSGVESLFKEGHIKVICCTSTLLQGVNLPAKHIVIENPMSGDKPMSRSDFLNLSGRAGRLLHEFHGNIWCIRPGAWNSDCYQGERLQEITSAISDVMKDGGIAIQNLLDSTIDDEKSKDDAEAAFGRLYHDYLLDQDFQFIEGYRNEDNTRSIDETVEAIKKVEITIPNIILENHQSLRPDHLQKLYDYLSGQLAITDFIPMSPYVSGAKERMEIIFRIISNCFDWSLTDRFMSWISFLAYRWVWGIPMGKILAERVSFVKNYDPEKSTSVIIRECLSVLENSIRFKLVKYYSAYIEILRHVMNERHLTDLINEIEPYHIYLEFGSCNKNALNLMALGMSRFTALHLENKFDFDEEVEAERYLEVLNGMNLAVLNMPAVCLREVEDLIG